MNPHKQTKNRPILNRFRSPEAHPSTPPYCQLPPKFTTITPLKQKSSKAQNLQLDKIKSQDKAQMLSNSKSFPNILLQTNGYIKINSNLNKQSNGNAYGYTDIRKKFTRAGKDKTNVGDYETQENSKYQVEENTEKCEFKKGYININKANQTNKDQNDQKKQDKYIRQSGQSKSITRKKQDKMERVRKNKFIRRKTLNIQTQDSQIRSCSIALASPSSNFPQFNKKIKNLQSQVQSLALSLSLSENKCNVLQEKNVMLENKINNLINIIQEKEKKIQELTKIINGKEEQKIIMEKRLQQIIYELQTQKSNKSFRAKQQKHNSSLNTVNSISKQPQQPQQSSRQKIAHNSIQTNRATHCQTQSNHTNPKNTFQLALSQFDDIGPFDTSQIGDLLSTAEYIQSLTDLEDQLHNKKMQIFGLNNVIEQLKMKQHFCQLRHEEAIKRTVQQWNGKYKKLLQMYKNLKDKQYQGVFGGSNFQSNRMKKSKLQQQAGQEYSGYKNTNFPRKNEQKIDEKNLRIQKTSKIQQERWERSSNGDAQFEQYFNLSLSTDRGQISGCF